MLRITVISLFIGICLQSWANAAPFPDKSLKDSKISYIKAAPPVINDAHLSHKFGKHLEKSQLDQQKIIDDKKKLTNHELMSKLGLAKLKVPPSHNRKRLAVESRHHAHPDDSNMFIIKLPPNTFYYDNNKPAPESKNSLHDNSKKVSLGFQSNGKPGRIYHWNLPILKKLVGGKHLAGRNPNSRHSDDESELIDIQHIPTWSRWENEAFDKQYRDDAELHEKILKKKSPTYYAPVRTKKVNFHKYFPGNGKPQSFYVIKKSQKPIHYQKLIP